jgi:hypothetical protein
MRTPDLHRIHTVRYGSPPPDPCSWAANNLHVWKVPILRHLVDPKHHILSYCGKLYFPWVQIRPIPPFYGSLNGYELDDDVDSSRLTPFGGFTRMPECLLVNKCLWSEICHIRQIHMRLEIEDNIHMCYADIYTRDWPSESSSYFWANLQCRYFNHQFFSLHFVNCEIIIV